MTKLDTRDRVDVDGFFRESDSRGACRFLVQRPGLIDNVSEEWRARMLEYAARLARIEADARALRDKMQDGGE